MEPPILWHDLLGLICTDFLADSPFAVETEKDLSRKKQLLDLVIVRKSDAPFSGRLPDGLDDLARHNLITFKSFQETLDVWAMKELLAHSVNYRKQVSPSTKDLLPESQFRLYAISARYPRELAAAVPLVPLQPGVYDCRWTADVVRVLVLHQLPLAEHNALLLLFSALPEQVRYATGHYRRRSPETSSLLDLLLERYREEGVSMAMTMEEFRHYYLRYNLPDLTPEERLEGLPPEERLKGLPPEERLKGLPPEERLKGLPPEERLKGLPPEELLKRLSREEIENYLKRLKDESSPAAGNGNEGTA